MNASPEELMLVKGIGKVKARKIKEFIKKEKL
jgi:ERCC4-type nuclease